MVYIVTILFLFSFSAAELRGDMSMCYHKECDNLETMLTEENIKFLGKTADVVAATIHSLSDATGGYTCADPEGAVGLNLHEKSQSYGASKQYWSGSPENHKATKPAFNIRPSSVRQRNYI